jgi:hypothetical protein
MNNVKFRQALIVSFSNEDLDSIMFDMGIDPDNVKGQSKDAKARELISYCDRRSKLRDLAEQCYRERPSIDWLAFLQQDVEDAKAVPSPSTSTQDVNEPDPDQTSVGGSYDPLPSVTALQLIGRWQIESIAGNFASMLIQPNGEFFELLTSGLEFKGHWKLDTVNGILLLLGALTNELPYAFLMRITSFSWDRFYARGEDGLLYRYTRLMIRTESASTQA